VSTARDAILDGVRKALGKRGADADAILAAQRYIDEHRQGPRPAMPVDLVAQFMKRATDMQSTVERIDDRTRLPVAVARYLNDLARATAASAHGAHKAASWPQFADLDWTAAGIDADARPATGDDRVGITGVFCAIAETGTLVVLAGADTPTASTLLPETHIAVVPSQRIVSGMEEAFALIRKERGRLPRAVNLISGPSRTGDIEQTIVLGAHGPYRVHIVVVAH
jgi:L-lactate dehydrogenase complex protein LldG